MTLIRRDHENRAWNADQAARTCERFVYSIVKMRFYDYKTWSTFVWEIPEVRKGLWAFFFFLIVIFACWLAGQANSDHMIGMTWVLFFCHTYSFLHWHKIPVPHGVLAEKVKFYNTLFVFPFCVEFCSKITNHCHWHDKQNKQTHKHTRASLI